jgi:hypothetical protein
MTGDTLRGDSSCLARVPRLPALALSGIVTLSAFGLLLLLFPGLTNDDFMHLAWAQQVLLGEWPGRDFVDPGYPLQWGLSALMQVVVPGTLGEALLTAAALAFAAGATCFGMTRLTGSAWAGTSAALIQLAFLPRLYSYPKVLVPALLLPVGLYYAEHRRGRFALALVIAIAFLFRHDLGGYAAVFGGLVAVFSEHGWKQRAREVLHLGALTILWLSPYFLYVHGTEGLPLHIHNSREYFSGEVTYSVFDWPQFDQALTAVGHQWTINDAATLLFYVGYALPLLAVALLLRTRHKASSRTAVLVAFTGLAVCYDAILLRNVLVVRAPDLAAIYAILGTWISIELWRRSRARMFALRAALLASLAILVVAVGTLGNVVNRWRDAGLLFDRPVGRSISDVYEKRGDWPSYWDTANTPAIITYINECMLPDEYFLTNWFAPEYYVSSRRGFAAGHAVLLGHANRSDDDQIRMLNWLRAQQAPVVLLGGPNREAFEDDYPLLGDYIRRSYESVELFPSPGVNEIELLVLRRERSSTAWQDTNWPCPVRPLD